MPGLPGDLGRGAGRVFLPAADSFHSRAPQLHVRAGAGWADPGMAQLAARGGRGSRKAASGVPTPVVSADQLLCGPSASFFNIDVEGAEREAILGAAETIRRCRPKLLLAAYHRSEDLFALSQLVFSIRSDYQLYLRHHRQLPAWDVNFYFV